MKKIVAMGAVAALASGLVFADAAASNPSVVDFTGNAEVKWGMDLDAGQHGFKNSQEAKIKLQLVDGGDKTTEGDDVWAELVIKNDASDKEAKDEADENLTLKGPKVDTAKIHIGNIYVGIKSGDTLVGKYNPVTAIRSGDNDNGIVLEDVGAADFTQGIVAGYADDNFDVAVDLRSYYKDGVAGQYSSAYAVAAEVSLKDSNEFVEGLEAKAGVSYNISKEYVANSDTETAINKEQPVTYDTPFAGKTNVLGYTVQAAYKLALDDTYYVKPSAAFTGVYASDTDAKTTGSKMNVGAGVLLGWGDTADDNAGVYFLDDDDAKKVTPGVGVTALIPLASTLTVDGTSTTAKPAYLANIKASFFSGSELVEGLKAAAYAEINLPNTSNDAMKDAKTEMAVAAALAYDVAVDEMTVTPKAGFRYANKDAVNAGVAHLTAEADDVNVGVFKKMGDRETADDAMFNLKVGMDVAGLINNTTFSVEYASANLMNKKDYGVKMYNVKAGTLNVGCKIAF